MIWHSRKNLAAAQALNTLDKADRTRAESELKKSKAFQVEVDSFSEVAAQLAELTVPASPPEYLRTRVFAQIENTPQLVGEKTFKAAAGTARVRRPVFYGAITAGAAALVAVTAVISTPTPTVPTAPVQASGVTAIQQASDQHSTDRNLPTGGTAEVIWSPKDTTAAVRVLNTAAPSGSVYQMWITDASGATRSAGLVKKSGDWVLLHGVLRKHSTIRMTVEPAGGSTQPTSTPLFAVSA